AFGPPLTRLTSGCAVIGRSADNRGLARKAWRDCAPTCGGQRRELPRWTVRSSEGKGLPMADRPLHASGHEHTTATRPRTAAPAAPAAPPAPTVTTAVGRQIGRARNPGGGFLPNFVRFGSYG